MIRFYCIEFSSHHNHAEPGSIGLKVIGFGVCNRVSVLESAQVCDHRPGVVPVDLENAVGCALQPMRTAGSRRKCIEGVSYKFHVGNTTDQSAQIWTGLAGRQTVDNGRYISVGIN